MKPTAFDDLTCVFLAGLAAAVFVPLCLIVLELCHGVPPWREEDFMSAIAFFGLGGLFLGMVAGLLLGMPAMLLLRRMELDRPFFIVPIGSVIGVLADLAAFHWHGLPLDSIVIAAAVGAACGGLASVLRMHSPKVADSGSTSV